MQTAVRFAVCITLIVILLSGCAAENGGGGGLMQYAGADASYTAEFLSSGSSASDGSSIVCACERNGGTTVMRVMSPERLNGLTVTYDGNACSVSAGETAILLSPDVAAGLTDVFDLLARTVEDGGTPSKSADGSQTVVTFSDGSVTLAPNGAEESVPVEVRLGERVIRIGEFVIQ